jgi:hypothetical protein
LFTENVGSEFEFLRGDPYKSSKMNHRLFALVLAVMLTFHLRGNEKPPVEGLRAGLGSPAEKLSAKAQAEQVQQEAKSAAEAMKALREEAKNGSAQAQYELFSRYSQGDGMKADPIQALVWLRKSAEQGYGDALVTLARRHATGEGVPQDRARAATLARAAAQQGLAEAQYLLGTWYMKGSVFAQNRQEGFRWLKKAAEQNFPDAQLELSSAYELGLGTVKNPVESYFWMQVLVTRSPDAPQQPEAMAVRERLATKLNVAQIAHVQARARTWNPASPSTMLLAKNQ